MNFKIVAALIFTGIAFIITALILPQENFDFISTPEIATITQINSELQDGVTVRGLDQYQDIPAKESLKLRNLDLIRTLSLSEAVIKFKSLNDEFKILENSEVLIEEIENKKILVTIRNGDILIENFEEASFWVRKDGRQLIASEYVLTNDKNLELVRQKGIKTKSESDTLTQVKIEEILTAKKSDFFRCYGQLIQKNEQAHGQVLISFEISTSGKVSKATMNRADIEDKQFKNCLLEVISRIQFPSFTGSPISMVFPLKFD